MRFQFVKWDNYSARLTTEYLEVETLTFRFETISEWLLTIHDQVAVSRFRCGHFLTNAWAHVPLVVASVARCLRHALFCANTFQHTHGALNDRRPLLAYSEWLESYHHAGRVRTRL